MRFWNCSGLILIGLSSVAFGGADLVCSEINGASSFGTNGEGLFAYSFGTVVCNIGDEALGWNPDTNEHPLISQSLYKLKDHQLTQIGIGFVRHTSIPLSGNACGTCQPAGFFELGSGCSDSSSALINGAQQLMGPRREVNAQSGDYPYPFTSINQTGDAVYKRLQVLSSEIDDPDALYFVEVQVISRFEDSAETRNNNVSYRQVIFEPGSLSATLAGPTYSEQSALNAWRDHGNGIGIPDSSVMIYWGSLPDSEELFGVGSRATELGLDHWRYDYAVCNMNGERGIRRISGILYLDSGEILVGSSFDAPVYHDELDGEISNAEWDFSSESGFVWETDQYLNNPNANAVRWGTTYSFSFEVQNHFGPSMGEAISLEPFGAGEPDGYNPVGFPAWSPPHKDFFCSADLGGNPDGSPDGILNFTDVSAFLTLYSAMQPAADFNYDGDFNFLDVSAFLQAFQAGCP